jgi:phosphatidylserine/phosphatidylglycerophosphate/cardiolipin synthase-like enzyme
MNLVFRENRNINSTLAWIVILMLMPAFGIVAYIIFGRNFTKSNIFKLKERDDKVFKDNILKTQLFLEVDKNMDRCAREYSDMITSLSNSNNAHYTSNNTVDIQTKPEEFFNSLKDSLRNAEKNINMLFYIFRDDDIGKEIIDILVERANAGVEVRFLYDAMGSRTLSDKGIQKLKSAGIKTSSFFPSILKYININANYRNHRKIVVIDNEIGYVGGFNVGDEYLSRNCVFGEWRDTHIKLTGDSVKDLNMRFLLDWRYSSKESIHFCEFFGQDYPGCECTIENCVVAGRGIQVENCVNAENIKNSIVSESQVEGEALLTLDENLATSEHRQNILDDIAVDNTLSSYYKTYSKINPPADSNVGMQIVSCGPDIFGWSEIKYGYLKMIQKSKKYVYIQTPYLILDSSFLDTLKIACLSGVDVRIMIPQKPDHPFVYWATYSYAGELLKYGAKIYIYNGGSGNAFLHAKTMVSDDAVCSIGTANMDIRSFELDFEVNAFIYSVNKSTELRNIFEDDLKYCEEITIDMYNNRPLTMRMKQSVSRLLSAIL